MVIKIGMNHNAQLTLQLDYMCLILTVRKLKSLYVLKQLSVMEDEFSYTYSLLA